MKTRGFLPISAMDSYDQIMDIFDLGLVSLPRSMQPNFISSQVKRGEYLFLDLEPPRAVGLAVACAGREECADEYCITRSGFRYHAVEFIVSGTWELKTQGMTQRVMPGTLFCYGPKTRYSLRALSKNDLVKYFVDFNGIDAAQLLRSSGLSTVRPSRIRHPRWIRDILDQLLDCANVRRPAARRMAPLLTKLLLARIREDIKSAPPPTHSCEAYERCRQCIADHYPHLQGVTEVADRCSISAAYLSRLFRRYAGETPMRFLTRLKIHHAAELIHRRGCSVKAAAAAVGFHDPYHFSRVFKRVHGVPPRSLGS